MKSGWRTIWIMTIQYTSTDIREYHWIENEHGESAFIWRYVSKGW